MSIVNLSQIAQALDAMMPELTPVPVGTIDFAHDVPEGWLECNGAAVSRTKYARLFKKLGTKYGAGDGSTTFNLPNLHHRVLEGTNTTNEVAKYQEAGLPDISGHTVGALIRDGSQSNQCEGAFSYLESNDGLIQGGGSGYWASVLQFNASRSNATYKQANTNQMASLRLMAIIRA